ncbi:MAG: thiopeptide-type bacteriocin biosynthesis protein [Gaiellaceae bacterium]
MFPPGSAWTYLKLFASPPAVDRILVEELAPLMADLEASGAVDRWFFVRYDQPDFHLRVRCRGGPVVRQTLEAASARLLDRRLVWQAELGTYVRELERYGGAEAIEHAEAVFHADSAAVVELLGGGNTAGAGAASDLRWQLALYGAHVLLLDLGIDRVARYDIVRSSRDALADEYGLSRREAGNIGSRFRQERQVLAALVCGDVPAAGRVFERRSQAVRASAEGLKRLERAAALTRPRQEIAASLVHMHLNRFLRSRHREQELVILEFLSRLYRAEL